MIYITKQLHVFSKDGYVTNVAVTTQHTTYEKSYRKIPFSIICNTYDNQSLMDYR